METSRKSFSVKNRRIAMNSSERFLAALKSNMERLYYSMQCIAISAYDAYNRGMPHYTVDEPIYALATPFAPSALAVIRASGDGVLSMLEPLFAGKLMKAPTNTAVHGFLVGSDGRKIDEVVIIKYGKVR